MTRERLGTVETAVVGNASLLVNQAGKMEVAGRETDAIAAVLIDDRAYEIGENGVSLPSD